MFIWERETSLSSGQTHLLSPPPPSHSLFWWMKSIPCFSFNSSSLGEREKGRIGLSGWRLFIPSTLSFVGVGETDSSFWQSEYPSSFIVLPQSRLKHGPIPSPIPYWMVSSCNGIVHFPFSLTIQREREREGCIQNEDSCLTSPVPSSLFFSLPFVVSVTTHLYPPLWHSNSSPSRLLPLSLPLSLPPGSPPSLPSGSALPFHWIIP